ncbi:MAG: C25 family cysteine peptidase [Candidatus Marinimicrobia bacterium]|nr:C25 family cysteine peptidase [Candidatus Neomarinimicrobiota bacterium]
MTKSNKIIFTLLIASSILFSQDEIRKSLNGFSNLDDDRIHFSLDSYELKDVTIDGQTFKKPVIPFGGLKSDEGDPSLPTITTFYQVAPNKSYAINVNVISSEWVNNIDILPHQTWERLSDETSDLFKRNIELYTSDMKYPENQGEVSNTFVFRDIPVVKASITPFKYYPLSRRLEIITSADIELIEVDEIEPVQTPDQISRVFEPLYEALVVNYNRSTNDDDYQRPSILYILPSNSSNLMANLEILFNWRHRSGYVVNYVSTSTTGNSSSSIKNYISNAYSTWDDPPEYIALVGDANGSYSIPTYFESLSSYNGEGDHPYSQLVGNDILPEVIIGRLSFSSTTELATIINKTVQYESNPYLSQNWFHSASLVGDASTSGVSCVITSENIKELMEYHGYDDVRTIYNSPFPSQMVADLNAGLTFFNYRGYYGVSGFNSGNINSLSNGFKLPIATVITCGTGSFSSGTSLSETFVRAGTPTQPKGAVASIGTATIGTHTMFNNAVDMGFYYGVFVDKLETAGAALARGKLNLYLNYPDNPNDWVTIFTHWNNLIGDPALQMWTDTPQSFTVTHENIISSGTNFYDVEVTNYFNEPVENAFVTILKGNDIIFESGYTDINGRVTLPVGSTLSGGVNLTVIKRNFIPYQGQFQISEQSVNVNSVEGAFTIDDDMNGASTGNSNALIDGGETIELTIPVYNYGTDNAEGVYCKLIGGNGFINYSIDSLYVGTLMSGMTGNEEQPFVFEVESGILENENFPLRLLIKDINGSSWLSQIQLSISGTRLVADKVYVHDDPAFGNDYLDPGETAEISIEISNIGSMMANNVSGRLYSNYPGLEIIDDQGFWPLIVQNNFSINTADKFEVVAAEDIIPGTVIELFIDLESPDGAAQSANIPLQIGVKEVDDPLGPDSYGYYAYDSGDILYSNAPYFNWIEIDPLYNGSGTQLSLSDYGDNQDDVTTVNLPFTFKFYGIDYDQISVSSNGWVSMGSTSIKSFRNYHIPGPGGPSPMIAVFWDDLNTTTSGGRVYKWYDELNHQFIIQWSHLRTYDNNSLENFQLILKDSQHYFTPTGDGEIVMQYADFNNTSTGNYGWGQVHGNYCTIGLEDQSETIGLEYTFNNTYPISAMPLEDSTAILFTTRGANILQRGDINQDGLLNITDVLTLVDFVQSSDTGGLNPYLADVNADEIINFLDMISIVREIMGY